jgi:hypothetical protein
MMLPLHTTFTFLFSGSIGPEAAKKIIALLLETA